MQRRKYYRRISKIGGRWGYTAWLHSDPSIRQTGSHPQWDAEGAIAAAEAWASEFFIASETPIDAEFSDEECEGR